MRATNVDARRTHVHLMFWTLRSYRAHSSFRARKLCASLRARASGRELLSLSIRPRAAFAQHQATSCARSASDHERSSLSIRPHTQLAQHQAASSCSRSIPRQRRRVMRTVQRSRASASTKVQAKHTAHTAHSSTTFITTFIYRAAASFRDHTLAPTCVPLPFAPSFARRSFVLSFVRWFVRSLVRWFLRSFVRSLLHETTRSLDHSFTRSLVRSFARSFARCKTTFVSRHNLCSPACHVATSARATAASRAACEQDDEQVQSLRVNQVALRRVPQR